ncbi:MAG: vWA domain-containing protein, partial [Pseudomonadota bacterium]
MKAQIKKFSSGFLVFAMASLGGMSAQAEDTEIFFNSTYNSGIQPNVLFIIDNSGSMKETDGGTTTRMDRVKSAMNSLLGGLSNVNVGLMQYSMPGGPVLFPVTSIDAPLVKPQTLSLSLASGSDDAE